ncbi:MAG TPA: hypothetical protein VGV59_03805 [Pyrinomonadaceae bacterium]|nr:hypothetical protein [Pyrinomonadaceae bacterium]
MLRRALAGVVLLCLLASCWFDASARVQRRGARGGRPRLAKVCGDPTVPCRTVFTFQPYDLPFRVATNAVIDETESFYAVILKSVRPRDLYDCETFVSESERLAAQALFPRHKVFASRCYEAGELYYEGVAEDRRFMAVYAGLTRAEAARTLARVRATGKFPGANLRRLRAGVNGT